MSRYSIFKEQRKSEDNGTYTVYGIEIIHDNGESEKIHDISSDRDRMDKFLSLLNGAGASPEHITDLIEDFFYCGCF